MLGDKLEEYGELMVKVEEIEQPLELHLHDTEIDGKSVKLHLSDGVFEFDADRVSASWYHQHSLSDFGLE